jgi:hypothetical protein
MKAKQYFLLRAMEGCMEQPALNAAFHVHSLCAREWAHIFIKSCHIAALPALLTCLRCAVAVMDVLE